jgi:uncharacterized protein (TIGR02147 family)
MKLSPFKYTDYRLFLGDFFKDITYSSICEKTGIKSPGHLSLILHGKANISEELAKKFARLCELKKRETEYFILMVDFNQEKKSARKMDLFERLISFRESCIYRVGPHLYKYYDKWYHSIIRAIVEFADINNNFDDLAKLVVPSIRPDQAKSSLKLIEELGLIQRNEQGFFRPTQKSIDSGVPATSLMINGFMLSMLDRARESMDRFSRDERKFSSVTLGVNQAGYEELVTELREFRRHAAEIAARHPADRVVQVNFQVFPVSRCFNQGGGKNE